jgi:hypothetical protein
MKKHVIFITFLWAIANAIFALEPHLEVTAIDSVAIPYEYDYVMQLDNGNLQFYKVNYGTSSIQFYGFQFLAQTNEVTPRWISERYQVCKISQLTNDILFKDMVSNTLSIAIPLRLMPRDWQ